MQRRWSGGWVVRLWVLVIVFTGVAVVRSVQVGIPLRDPGGAILRLRVLVSLVLFAVLAIVDAGWRARAQRASGVRLRDVLRRRWPVRRLALALGALLAYHLVYFSYHNLKSWDSFNRPRDAMLLRWDRWLFLGRSSAVLLHHALGQHVAAYALMVVYESFSTVITVAVVAAVVFVDRIRDGYVFIASAAWAWILGVGSYYLIPSLGPFWSAPREFAGLPHSMVQDTQVRYLAQRTHLLTHPHAADAFAQVSAFASLHVAMTTVILLMARYYGLRRTSRVLAVFLAATMTATVYFGWHFFVDDLAGLAIAVVAVLLGRTMAEGAARRTTSGPGGPSPENWREIDTRHLVDVDPTPS